MRIMEQDKKMFVKRIIAYVLVLTFIFTTFIFMSLYLLTLRRYYTVKEINEKLIESILYYGPQKQVNADNCLPPAEFVIN